MQPAAASPNLRDYPPESLMPKQKRKLSWLALPSLLVVFPACHLLWDGQTETEGTKTLTSYSSAWKGERVCNLVCSHIDKDLTIFHIPFTPSGSVLTLGAGRSESVKQNPQHVNMSSYSSVSLHLCIPMHALPVPTGKMGKQLSPAGLPPCQAEPELELVDDCL